MPTTDLTLADQVYGARQQARELNDAMLHTIRDEAAAVLVRYGIPPELRSVVADLVRYEDPMATLRWLAALDLHAISDEIAAVYAHRSGTIQCVCDGCAGVFTSEQLVNPAIPGEGGEHYCEGCLPVAQARESHRLARRGINSALARARAANLPATLTRAQWAETLAHFGERCAYCKGEWYIVEHVKPISQGGGSTWGNCVPACFKCNNGKEAGHVKIAPEIRAWLTGRV